MQTSWTPCEAPLLTIRQISSGSGQWMAWRRDHDLGYVQQCAQGVGERVVQLIIGADPERAGLRRLRARFNRKVRTRAGIQTSSLAVDARALWTRNSLSAKRRATCATRCQRMRAPIFGSFEAPASKYRIIRASTRSRQQRGSGPQGAQEEDAARGHFPRDEASRPLREAVREAGAREGGGGSARAQARSQEAAARGPPSDQAEAGSGAPRSAG